MNVLNNKVSFHVAFVALLVCLLASMSVNAAPASMGDTFEGVQLMKRDSEDVVPGWFRNPSAPGTGLST